MMCFILYISQQEVLHHVGLKHNGKMSSSAAVSIFPYFHMFVFVLGGGDEDEDDDYQCLNLGILIASYS